MNDTILYKNISNDSSDVDYTCGDDFYMTETNGCRPYCQYWTQYTDHSQAIALSATEAITSAIGLLFSIATLIIACFRHKVM